MKLLKFKLVASLLVVFCATAGAQSVSPNKETAVASVKKHSDELTNLSDQIWKYAETALKETKSSKALADYAEQQGFKVERGVAEMPTAFVASYGQGRPIIGILGEYDALPGLSQKVSTEREPLEAGKPGHGCGHNMFGAASMGAAVAIKELIAAGKLSGTIRFYGTPAEEAVGGKIYMARAGLFKDLDICLAWHPDTKTAADTGGSQAIIDFIVEFHGKAAHAALDPWDGRSAVDGLEIFTHALNMMREHVKPTVRIHYVIQNGGDVPNVVPEYAKVWVWVRDSKHESVDELMTRVRKMADGAAMAADVTSNLTIQTGDYEMLVNKAGHHLLQTNIDWLGQIQYTPEEQEFAKKIQKASGVPEKGLDGTVHPYQDPPKDPEGGSSDVGDVSWSVPVINLVVTTAPIDSPWHAWPVVACGGMSIGHKGLVYAAEALAATIVDLYEKPDVRAAMRKEFDAETTGKVYKAYIPDGPPPVPKEVSDK